MFRTVHSGKDWGGERRERVVYNEIDVWFIGAWNKRLVERIRKSCISGASRVVCIYV